MGGATLSFCKKVLYTGLFPYIQGNYSNHHCRQSTPPRKMSSNLPEVEHIILYLLPVVPENYNGAEIFLSPSNVVAVVTS